ncbi:SWIM zinc finger family protein, partial [Streptomyces sp. NPDC003832]
MTARPSEEARRALREARRRAGTEDDAQARPAVQPVRPTGRDSEPRPADEARAALRRQTATPVPAAEEPAEGPAGPVAGSDAPLPEASLPEARPADVAREALRAARRDRHRTDAHPEQPRPTR